MLKLERQVLQKLLYFFIYLIENIKYVKFFFFGGGDWVEKYVFLFKGDVTFHVNNLWIRQLRIAYR